MSFPIERLREIREQRGISQTALAKHLGVGRRSVVRWESGNVTPTALALGALSAFFGDVDTRKAKRRTK